MQSDVGWSPVAFLVRTVESIFLWVTFFNVGYSVSSSEDEIEDFIGVVLATFRVPYGITDSVRI